MYIILLILIIFIVRFYYDNRICKNSWKTIAIFILLLLSFLFICREVSVGTDYKNYINHFESDYIRHLALKAPIIFSEPLWEAINYLLYQLNLSYLWLSVSVAGISMVLIFDIAKKSSEPLYTIFLFFVLYFYYAGYNIQRQYLAALFVLNGLLEFKRKHLIKFMIFSICAILFHKSALLFLILLPLINFLNLNKKSSYFLLAVSIIFIATRCDQYIYSNYIQSIVSATNSFERQYSQYLEPGHLGLNTFGYIMRFFLLFTNIFLFYFIHRNIIDKFNIYSKLWFIGILFNIITFNYMWLFRFAIYFMITSIIAIPQIMVKDKSLNPHNSKALRLYILYIILIGIHVCKLYNNEDGIVPYVFNFI